MTRDEFAHYYRIWSDYIRRTARRKSRDRRYLADDLEQATLCMLWELDLSSVRGNTSSFIRGAIGTCMRSVIRAEHRGWIIPAWTPPPTQRLPKRIDPAPMPGGRGEGTRRRDALPGNRTALPDVPGELSPYRPDVPEGSKARSSRRARRRTLPVMPQPRRVPRHPNRAAPHEDSC